MILFKEKKCGTRKMKISDELWDFQKYQSREKLKQEIEKLLSDSLPDKIRNELQRIKNLENAEIMLNHLGRLQKKIDNNYEIERYGQL